MSAKFFKVDMELILVLRDPGRRMGRRPADRPGASLPPVHGFRRRSPALRCLMCLQAAFASVLPRVRVCSPRGRTDAVIGVGVVAPAAFLHGIEDGALE